MEQAIAATLTRMRTTRFARGTNDCDAIMSDYVFALTGRDPMAKWRGTYDDDAGAMALIEAAGGNGALVREGMASLGLEPHPGPARRGDVVVIDYHGEEVMGLYLDPFTALKTARGARQSRFAKIISVWRLP